MTTVATRRSGVFFENFDSLRFLAFFAVFLAHTFNNRTESDRDWLPIWFLKRVLFASADLGVAFFFVLSGFLITYLLLKEIELTGTVNVSAFYVRRCLRIWPLYYTFLAIVWTGLAWQGDSIGMSLSDTGSLAYFVFFASNFLALWCHTTPLVLAITWSIAVEEQFYSIWPLVMKATPRARRGFVFAAIIVLSLVFRAVYRNQPLVLIVHSFSVMGDLAVGGGLAYLSLSRPGFVYGMRQLPRSMIAAGYLVGLGVVLLRDQIYLGAGTFWMIRVAALLIIVRRLAVASFFAFVLAEQTWAQRSLYKLGSVKVLNRLGTITYGLYLLHPVGLLLADLVLPTWLGQVEWLRVSSRGTLGLFLSLAMAFASYELLEKRLLRLKSRFAKVESRSAPPAA